MIPSLWWRVKHWIGGGNIGVLRRYVREQHRKTLDSEYRDKMSCEYMATLEVDELLEIQSKHRDEARIVHRVEFEMQRRLNQDQIDAIYGSAWIGGVFAVAAAFLGLFGVMLGVLITKLLS